MSDTKRAAFEAWLKAKPEARFWNTTDAMFAAWIASSASSIDSKLDSNTLKKMAFLSESKKMRPVGVVLIDDATGQRATIDMGRVTWTGSTAEESLVVQPGRVALSDDLRVTYTAHTPKQPHGIRDKCGFLIFFPAVVRYYGQEDRYKEEIAQQNMLANFLLESLDDRAILAAQADAGIPASTIDPFENDPFVCEECNKLIHAHAMSKQSDGDKLVCVNCALDAQAGHDANPCNSNSVDYQFDHIVDVNKKVSPIAQPMIAEAARDDASNQMSMVGACLAHVAINYSRRIGHTLDSDDCTLLRKLHDQWIGIPPVKAVKRDDVAGDAR